MSFTHSFYGSFTLGTIFYDRVFREIRKHDP